MAAKRSFSQSRSLGTVSGRKLLNQLPAEERPQARAHDVGFLHLSTSELLALVLDTVDALDLARDVLATCDRLADLAGRSPAELAQVPGISDTLALRVLAASELGRRLNRPVKEQRPRVTSPGDVVSLVQDMFHLQQEHLRVLPINSRSIVTEQITVYIGSPFSVSIRPADVLQPVIARRARGYFMVHNHPSGDASPSYADVEITQDLARLSDKMGILFVDHIIVSAGGFASMREHGILQTELGFGGEDETATDD